MEGERSEATYSWDADPLSGIIPRCIHQIFDTLESAGQVLLLICLIGHHSTPLTITSYNTCNLDINNYKWNYSKSTEVQFCHCEYQNYNNTTNNFNALDMEKN